MSDANNSLNPNTAAAATDPWADASAALLPPTPQPLQPLQAPIPGPPPPRRHPMPGRSLGRRQRGDAAGGDWLGASAGSGVPEDAHASLWHQLTTDGLPVQGWINSGLEWVVHHFRPFFQAVRTPSTARCRASPMPCWPCPGRC